jgi:hypothetical protein
LKELPEIVDLAVFHLAYEKVRRITETPLKPEIVHIEHHEDEQNSDCDAEQVCAAVVNGERGDDCRGRYAPSLDLETVPRQSGDDPLIAVDLSLQQVNDPRIGEISGL